MTFSFYLFAILGVLFSICVISFRNPVHSALALVGALFSTAGIYVLLNAEFLAALEIIIYAGAIMVLFLFVLMCLNIRELKMMPQFNVIRPLAIAAGVFLLAEIVIIIIKGVNRGAFGTFKGLYNIDKIKELGGNTHVLGQVLYAKYLLPFEVVSVVLLVAMIGAIVLMKEESRKK